ncbi:MAG: replicative DNA helicase [Desulfovibrionaceae bacterium]
MCCARDRASKTTWPSRRQLPRRKVKKPRNQRQTQSKPFSGSGASDWGRRELDGAEKATADLLRKVPPHNAEAEQAVLGGIFLKNSIFHSLADSLASDDFYFPAHADIYEACLELYHQNAPLDLVTVADYLSGTGKLDDVGGAVYLAELAQATVSAANAEYYAKIVRDKALARELIDAAAEIISNCYDAGPEVEQLMDESEQAVFAITERATGSNYRSSKDIISQVFKDLEQRVNRNELVTGVNTGYHRLNELTAGFQPTDLIIIAARPSMGKTAFALNVAMRAAVMHQIPTAIFSLEMSTEQLMMRMLCAWGKVDLSRLRRGFLDDDDWMRLHDAANHLSLAPIFIDDTPALTTMELRARCRRLKAEKDLGLVLVDYLQLMRSSRRIDSREQEISDISRTLKALAKEIHVPVLALSQLNRKVEERTNKRPMLSDLRESGAIEQDADVIMFIYRDDVYNKRDDNPKKGTAEIIIGKQRNGPTGDLDLAFLNYCTAFEELDTIYGPSEQQG